MPSPDCLVTGATGFLGSRLARRLVERGERVRALVRPSSDLRRIADLVDRGLTLAAGDIVDRGSVERALDGVSRLYHCAALYRLGEKDPSRMERINVGGTETVLGAAKERGIPSVYVSSVAALGPTTGLADETHWNDAGSGSAYETTKRAAHLVARHLALGAKIRIASPVTIFGPDDPSLVGELHKWFARGVVRAGALPHVKMTLVHVDDCAAGLVLVAERGEDGREYILADRSVSFREWFELLARVSGRRAPRLYVPDWALDRIAPLLSRASTLLREGLGSSVGQSWEFSGERARRELGFAPRGLEQGLRETMAWYR
jgi:nucleoside-diphosphate-sugar epimerase